MFAADATSNHVTLLAHSDAAERSWLLVHTNRGPHLVCAWYRPPEPGELNSIVSFQGEWADHRTLAIGGVAVGDLNVHNRAWLHYHSSHDSREGTALETACHELGLKQIVSEPTREAHLLDLVLTDIPDAKATVLPRIADHELVQTVTRFTVPEQQTVEREVWQFAKADWERLRDSLSESDWSFIDADATDEAAAQLTGDILRMAQECIPRRKLCDKKSTHPWLTDNVVELVRAKNAAVGTEFEREAAEACSAGILQEHEAYVKRTKSELSELPRGSKAWWSKSRELCDQRGKCCSIPALRDNDGNWVLDSAGKTELRVDLLLEVRFDRLRAESIQRNRAI